MSEIKRVALSTLEPQKVSDKVNKKPCKTIRISVILPESNEDNCPEYNYKDQLAAVKKRSKHGKDCKEPNNVENGLDAFGEDDDDVKRIALEMEAKYGTGMTSAKKKRKGRKDDYADIGMGYDESDSFIDNTDGYDEIIPQNVTTLHGGFYINSGALEFKTDDEASSVISSSSSDSEDENKPSSTNRKRILETSDDNDSDTASTSQVEKKPKLQSSKNTLQQAIKKKLFSQNKIQVKKRRLIDPLKKTVKELLREKREDLNMSLPVELTTEEQEDNAEKDSLKENKKPMSITSVTDAIEFVVKQIGEAESDSNRNKQNVDVNKKAEVPVRQPDAPPSLEGESSQEANKIEKEDVKLPENLPVDILDLINKVKQAALDYKGEGKKKFFTDEVNSMLLNLERKCKFLGKSSRVRIYDYLAMFIKCRRETLIRRAKNLVLEDEERRLKKLSIKLKENIDKIMPSLMINFEQESQRIIQKKFSKDSIDNEENKALKMPRRRFQWSEEARRLLKDILSVKKRCLLLEGKQKDNLEEQICQYLRMVILPLWPEGWMYLNSLKKVYNSMTENVKMSENNNSKPSTPKQHSNVTITPVASNSKPTSKPEVVPNNITFTKISTNEVKPSAKPAEIRNISAKPDTRHISTKSTEPNAANTQPSSFTASSLLSSFNPISQPPIPSIIQSISSFTEVEKPRHERDHDYKKYVAVDISKHIIKEPEVIKPIKPPIDNSVIVVNKQKDEMKTLVNEEKNELNTVIPKTTHCQLIDLTDVSDIKRKQKPEENRPFNLVKEHSGVELMKPSNSRELFTDVNKISTTHPDLSVTPNFLSNSTVKGPSKAEGDEIQMVMENLKALQKLSSPIKAENSTGSPVSVIAYNKSFSPKSNSSQSSAGQRTDFSNKTDFSGSFQDEFQKQFINSLQQMASASSSNKSSYNRCS